MRYNKSWVFGLVISVNLLNPIVALTEEETKILNEALAEQRRVIAKDYKLVVDDLRQFDPDANSQKIERFAKLLSENPSGFAGMRASEKGRFQTPYFRALYDTWNAGVELTDDVMARTLKTLAPLFENGGRSR